MAAFEGIWVPLVTPFRDGRVDLDAAQRLVQRLIDQGVDGLVVCGTTGEAATLNELEQRKLLTAVLESAAERCPVIYGVSGNDSAHVAHTLSRYSNTGITGFLVSAPYYVRPSQEGIRHHFETVAAATGLPIVLYNIPYRTGVNMELATIQALSRNRQFVAIKESGGNNLEQLCAIITETPLKVLTGEDTLVFVCACLGGHGAVTAAAHIRPDLYRRILTHVGSGEVATARRLANALQPLIRLLFAEPNPGPLKAALAMLGLIDDSVRLPMTAASAACRVRLAKVLPEVLALT